MGQVPGSRSAALLDLGPLAVPSFLVYWTTTAGPLGPLGYGGATGGSFFAGYRLHTRVNNQAVCSLKLISTPNCSLLTRWKSWLPHMEAAPGPSEALPKNSARNEKDRARRQAGGARHQQAILEKDAEIAHLTGNLAQVVQQMQTLRGVTTLVSDYRYQKSIVPWDDNEPDEPQVETPECRRCD